MNTITWEEYQRRLQQEKEHRDRYYLNVECPLCGKRIYISNFDVEGAEPEYRCECGWSSSEK